MEKLKINHDSDHLIHAFMNKERFDSIQDHIIDSVMEEDNVSKAIEKCIYAFSDSPEDTIAVVLTIASIHYSTRTLAESKKKSLDFLAKDMIAMMPKTMMKKYLAEADCKTCKNDGDCPIQKEATKRGLTW